MQAIKTFGCFKDDNPSPASRLLQNTMPRELHKGHAALRRGRVSIPEAEYFITVCTDKRRAGLAVPEIGTAILGELRALDDDSTWRLRCAVVMPDHIHLLIVLGWRLALGKTI